jgi:hypothetical protein
MSKSRESWGWQGVQTLITIRVAIVLLAMVLVVMVRLPLAFLSILVLSLAYSIYRIIKGWKTSHQAD